MAVTYRTATDLILTRLRTQWEAEAQAAVGGGYLPDMLYESSKRDKTPDSGDLSADDVTKAWARTQVRHTESERRGFGDTGSGLFTRTGVILVEVFAPFLNGDGYGLAQDLTEVAVKAFENKRAGAVWFRKGPAVTEIGIEGPWYKIEVNVPFTWDEVR